MQPHVWLLMLSGLLPAAPALSAEDLTIYRCVDARGKLTLRDVPCLAGEKQETRQMLRPQAPAMPATRARTRAEKTPALPPQAQWAHPMPPAPLYRCTAPDGSHYHNETGQGQLRWQPQIHTYGFATVPPAYGGVQSRLYYRDGRTELRIERGMPVPLAMPYPVVAGNWVADECTALSHAERCDFARARAAEIRRGYVHAMPGERRKMERESTQIQSQISTCPP